MTQKNIKIMISHANDEQALAEAWKVLLETISSQAISVWFSSDGRGTGGMPPGEVWRDSLERKLIESDLILAIQTPSSAPHNWIVWECGIIHGLRASDESRAHGFPLRPGRSTPRDHGVIPIVYAMKRGDLSNPLDTYQVYEGEDEDQVGQLCEYLLQKNGLERERSVIERAIAAYFRAIKEFHPRERVTEEQLRLWHGRLQDLMNAGRTNEILGLRHRMYAALIKPFEPIESAIHDRFSQALVDEECYDEALEEVNYALRIVKDDIGLLSRKALAEIERQNLRIADEVVKQILALDENLITDPEVASLKGRILREQWMLTRDSAKDTALLDAAIAAYSAPYEVDQKQYYPGINAAELLLVKGDTEKAQRIFETLLKECQDLQQQQVVPYWVDFTLGAIYLGLGDVDSAEEAYRRGLRRTPTPQPRNRKSALKGVRRMGAAKHLSVEEVARIEKLFV